MASDIEKRTLRIEKTFDAPRKLVWEAWTKADHIAHWWGPRGMSVKVVEHDFRVGGKWKYTMAMPDGNEFVTEGEYAEIVNLEKIVTSADFRPMTEGVTLVIELSDNGEKTDFRFSVIHPTEEYCKQQEDMGFYNGWGSVFRNLEAYLASRNEL